MWCCGDDDVVAPRARTRYDDDDDDDALSSGARRRATEDASNATLAVRWRLAYKRAVLNCIKYLSQFGYTEVRLCREYGACCRRCLEVRRRRRQWLNGARAVSRVISRDLV